MARTVEDYTAMAQAALAAGFTTKSAQQQAVSDLGRAYDLIKDQLRDAMIREANERYGNNEANWNARCTFIDESGYYQLPDYLHNLRDRHHAFLRDRKDEVIALRALLDQVKAAPVNKAPAGPTKQQIEDAAKMTCQCCGRPICANTGVIAHHGYTRPGWGWQTASCEGARELPFEASRDALGLYIARLKSHRLTLQENLKSADEPGAELVLVLDNYDEPKRYGHRLPLVFRATEATFEELRDAKPHSCRMAGLRSWALLKDLVKARLTTQLQNIAYELVRQQHRYDGWKQTHLWSAERAEFERVK